MIPLASWLECSWRHDTHAPGYSTVLAAAKRLDDEVWALHRFKLMFLDDPVRFRDLSEKEVLHADYGMTPEEAPDYPQLGTHADVTCRALSSKDFYSLIGCVTDRPLRCITMNTAALYEDECDLGLFSLFRSQRLWSDKPERDHPGLQVRVRSDDEAMLTPLPAVHLGTAWTTPLRRKQRIMERVSRLHRLVAYLRYGAVPQFATIVPDRNHDKLFNGRDIGAVIETRDGFSKETRVLFYAPGDIVSDAERILA